MSVLIDPYMFELSDEVEIKKNITFFQNIIKLTSSRSKCPAIQIALYKGMIEKLSMRSLHPFPIQISEVRDKELKRIILILNNQFSQALLYSIENLDIDECSGQQEFFVSDDQELMEDNNYYEMLCMLLIPCYSNKQIIDHRILTGIKKRGKQIGDTFDLECECHASKYRKKCVFSSVDEIIPIKEKAISELKHKIIKSEFSISTKVVAEMGSHHNHVQADGKKFNKLDDLSTKNKRVLNMLKYFGLFKIIFGAFTPKGVKEVGTMSIMRLEETSTLDILVVKFYAETEMQLETSLYFPKGIGKLLNAYFDSETLTYKSVLELMERIK